VIIGYFVKRTNFKWLTGLAIVSLVLVTIGSAYLKTVSDYALSAHVLHLKEDKVGRATWNFSTVSPKLQYANDVKKVLPEGTAVTVGYFPGALAYYAKLRVFAANGLSNGLISNNSFDKTLQDIGVDATMKKYNIAYHVVPLTNGPVLWFNSIGFNVSEDNGSMVMLYSSQAPSTCGLMRYSGEEKIATARLSYASRGYAGIFPTKPTSECSGEMKKYVESHYYTTMIGR
jgi:hypothetical protein